MYEENQDAVDTVNTSDTVDTVNTADTVDTAKAEQTTSQINSGTNTVPS